eukprot:g42890.t1
MGRCYIFCSSKKVMWGCGGLVLGVKEELTRVSQREQSLRKADERREECVSGGDISLEVAEMVANDPLDLDADGMVQNLAVRSQHSGALPAASPQSVPLKGTCQAQQLPLSHTKQAGQGAGLKANQHDSAPESTKKGESLTSVSPETRVSTVTRLQMPANTQQLIAP